ncbi:MAG: serine/threonine protein kinase, partial [Acidobacteria bacterium]|nr:serine/threonine protein kinase [Acidobacteriota bacterium]
AGRPPGPSRCGRRRAAPPGRRCRGRRRGRAPRRRRWRRRRGWRRRGGRSGTAG